MLAWEFGGGSRRKVKRKCQLTAAMMKEITDDMLVAKLLLQDVASKHGVKPSLVSYLTAKIKQDPGAFLEIEVKELT